MTRCHRLNSFKPRSVETQVENDGVNGPSLRVGWLIDGRGGPVQRDRLLIFTGGVIAGLEPFGTRPAPAPLLDLSSCTLLPAMTDCHVHLVMSGCPDPEVRRMQLRFSFEEANGVIRRHLDRHIAHGVLGVRDGGDYGGYALRCKREATGSARMPYLLCAGKGWHAAGRYGRLVGRAPLPGLQLPESIRGTGMASEVVKIVNSGINSLSTYGKETRPQFTPSELRGAVRAARDLNLRVMVHANGVRPVREAIEAGCGSIEHGFLMGRENLQRMADQGVTWVPTAVTMKGYARTLASERREAAVALRYLDHQLDQIRMARDLGVTLALGTDSGSQGVHHGESLGEEMGLVMEAGYSVTEAVRCATLNGSALLGRGGSSGGLTVGGEANFIAVPGGPDALPESLLRPEGVFIRGERIPILPGGRSPAMSGPP